MLHARIYIGEREENVRKHLMYAGLVAAGVLALAAASYARDDDNGARHIRAHLDGYHENPTLSTTGRGRFVATIRIDDDECPLPAPDNDCIKYKLVYSGLEGGPAAAAHIHLGMPWVNGGVSAFLCGGGDKPPCPPGVVDEAVVEGVIDPADVIGPTGQGIAPGEFAELVRAIRAGATYANVHNEGRPGGEIRGQITVSNRQRSDH
jgi:hypothetical protein